MGPSDLCKLGMNNSWMIVRTGFFGGKGSSNNTPHLFCYLYFLLMSIEDAIHCTFLFP